MSDEPAKPAEPTKSKPPKVMLALLVLNLGASGFTTFKVATAQPAVPQAEAPQHNPTTTEIVGPVMELDPFVVNLDEVGQSRYLKLTLQFELTDGDSEASIVKSKQLVRDTILSHLSGLHVADTLGVAAKDKLRADVMTKLEVVVGPGKVRRVFFHEFVVQ